MIVYFDTVRRQRPVREAGELVMLDWERQRVLRRLPLFPSEPDILDDPNPRGNSRGGKGIVVVDDEVWVGTYHTLLVFDRDLALRRRVSHALFANLHEMARARDALWVSSTAIDAALKLTISAETTLVRSFWPRAEPVLQRQLGLVPSAIDERADHRLLHLHASASTRAGHTHLNGLVHWGERTLALLHQVGALVEVEPSVGVWLCDPLLRGAHSPILDPEHGWLILCRSQHREVLCFDVASAQLARRLILTEYPELAVLLERFPDQPFSRSLFTRGLSLLPGGRLLVGLAPASIAEIELDSGRLVTVYRHSDDVADAIHGLAHQP